jgi:hypothetical protein
MVTSGAVLVQKVEEMLVKKKPRNKHYCKARESEPGRNRTFDQRLKRPLLYQLSYGPGKIERQYR